MDDRRLLHKINYENGTIEIEGKTYEMTCVSMGNPHAIIFMDNVKELDIEAIGPYFENHPVFPKEQTQSLWKC